MKEEIEFMKIKNLFKKNWQNILIWAIMIFGVVWAGKGLFKYEFYSLHDLDHHLARSYDAIQTIAEGQFPLRFAGTLNYGCGVQIYNFFYPLFYYLVIVLYWLFNDVFLSYKIISFISLLLGTIFFYLWTKKETNNKLAAFSGAMLYLYAPYRFLLIYVRGSPEYLAYAIWPVVLYFFSLAFSENNSSKFIKYCFFAALFGGLLTISHNFTVMLLMPILLLYLIIKIFFYSKNSKKRILLLIYSFISAFGLGAFFIFPALIELKFTKLSLPMFVYYEHFPELWQVIRSKWGYFYSFPGVKDDGMSFQLGYAHWFVLAIVSIWLVFKLYKTISQKVKLSVFLKENILILSFYLISIVSLYLTLPYSRVIWDKVHLLQSIQFPWRLLGIDVLAISTTFVFWVAKIRQRPLSVILIIIVSMLAFIGNRNHLLSQPVMDNMIQYYRNPETNPLRYSYGSFGADVLPVDMKNVCYFTDKFIRTNEPNLDGTDVSYKIIEKISTRGSVEFLFDTSINKSEKIILNLSYFPNVYKFSINGKSENYSNCEGYVCLGKQNLIQGVNFVSWKVVSTSIENIFNIVTLSFVISWIFILIGFKRIKKLLPFLLILGVFIAFRSINLPDRLGFGWDQERDANAASNILLGDFTLIGPRIQGPGGFYLPPYFFYLLSPFYAIAGGGPLATVYFVIFISVAFFTVSYLILTKIFSKNTALVFLGIWAINPLAVSIDTIAWNPVMVPVMFILFLYAVYLYFKNNKKGYLWLIGILYGLGISFHMQFIFYGLMLVPLFIEIFRRKKYFHILIVVAGTLLTFVPVLIFDLRHNFINLSLILGYLKNQVDVTRVLPVWDRTTSFILGIDPKRFVSLVFLVLVLLGIIALIRKAKNGVHKNIFIGLGLIWTVSLPLFFIVSKNPSDYYFNFMLPIFVLVFSQFIDLSKKKGVLIAILIGILFSYNSIHLLKDSHYNLRSKINSALFLKEITKGGTPFNISFNVPANEDSGFRYMLKYYKVNYTGDPKDTLFEYLIPYNRVSTPFVFKDIGILIPISWTDDNWIR